MKRTPHHLWLRMKQDPEREWNRAEQVVTIPTVLWLHKHCYGLINSVYLHTCVTGKAPVLSSGSAWRMDRKVSLPSHPSPARKACITGMTDSSRRSQCTKPSRYRSRKDLPGRNHSCCIMMLFKHLTNNLQFKNIRFNPYLLCYLCSDPGKRWPRDTPHKAA